MSIPPRLKAEFEAVIVALAREYMADREDVVAAARLVEERSPKPKKRPKIDDHAILREMTLTIERTGRSRWDVAQRFAEKAEGNSLDSTARRLHRKVKWYLKFKYWVPATDEPYVPFSLAREAIAAAPNIAREFKVNRLIGRRLNAGRSAPHCEGV
jgi:hypothetical protein